MVHAIAASAIGKNTAVRNRAPELAASQRTAAAGRIRSQADNPAAPAFSCSIRGISSSRLSRVKISKSDTSRGSVARRESSISSRFLRWLTGKPIGTSHLVPHPPQT
jgi:hypothetical protein